MKKMTADEIIKRQKYLKGQRETWESHWQELADYILPRKNTIIRKGTLGEKRGQFLFDNTGMVSAELLAGALHGYLTNPSTMFFELTTGLDEVDDRDTVRQYLQTLTERMHRILNESNFQTEVHELYLDLVTFGTGNMLAEEDEDYVIRFKTNHISDYVACENSRSIIEEVHFEFKWEAKKIIEFFFPDLQEASLQELEASVGRQVARSYLAKDNVEYKIIHSVYRTDLKVTAAKPFISQYILVTNKSILKEDGFRTYPYMMPRWTKLSGETYGRSPGMVALPEIKTVNMMTKAVIKGAQKTVDPPIQVPDDGFIITSTAPASIMYYRAGTNDRVQPVFNDMRLDVGVEITRDRQMRIREAFFVDQLQLRDGPQMTATEVNRRTEERMRLLGPMLGRQQSEFLKPLIDRLFDIMVRRELIGEPPEELSGVDLEVKYSSMIAKSQRIDDAQNTLRALQASMPFIELDQKGMDMLDVDQAIKRNWRVYGADQRILRSLDEVDQIRASRAQAQQQALQMEMDQQQAQVLKQVAPAARVMQSGGSDE